MVKNVTLRVGDTAPAIQTSDVFGNAVDLAASNDKFVLLVFLRYSGCPLCNLAIHRLTVEYPLLQKSGCEIIAFVQSEPQNIVRNIYGRHQPKPPFPIIADAGRKFYDLYGVRTSILAAARSITKVPYWLESVHEHGFKQTEIDGNLFLVPALFLIHGKTQEIVKIEYGTSFYDHDTFTEIYEPLIFR